METKVFSFPQGLKAGYEPAEYEFMNLPLGHQNVVLDFKIWSKNSPAVTMFCTVIETQQKIRFNVFRDNLTRKYLLKNTVIDVVEMEYKTEFKVLILENSKGNTKVEGL